MTTSTKTLWKIDPTHSEVQFKVKHLVISTVTGSFGSYDGTIETDGDDFKKAKATFSADIDSISTNNEDRDQHLKSDDFFNAEEFPQLKFESVNFEKIKDGEYKVTGDLTIRDVTKKVLLDVVHGGTVVDPYGQTKAGFEISGSINRKDFGLTWSAVTEAGNVVVGDQVKLQLNVQFVQS
ncbi:YceI family protein [Gracilimonas mengyeensis]|uniref:Polyisoprenoid-binding protein YceI n=1 Tax=Gracilimonas mengyeensis TaxID=1302730 RepID=A0A521CFD6_9BACT|nr:YceI family protein [Gracilimonas mengyeensis]SMO58112.1 Polyisoprenoid-binding protein YceI [Gracilimonas mengyeensis]